jgi:hypothetical protein
VQQIGQPNVSRSGSAMAMSSEFGRLMTSGFGSLRTHSTSFSNSLCSTPDRPCSVEMVRSPSMRALVDDAALVAKVRISHGQSKSLSSRPGVFRKIAACCCKYTLIPLNSTRGRLTLGSSVLVGV